MYISTDFNSDMERVMNHKEDNISREFVLSDYKVIKTGYVRQPDEELDENTQVVKMTNDRFMVPEVLFNPSDIGINQAGICEAISQSV